MNQFIYKEIPVSKLVRPHYQELDIDKLNELGADGWQLVTIQSGNCIFMKAVKKRVVSPL
jgi:hypothetical protein